MVFPASTTATRTLRPYQRDALEAVDATERVGITRSLIVHPTGTGKTVIFTALILSRLDRGAALVLVHTDELVRQTIERLREGGYAGEIGIVKAERDEHTAPVVIASVQTLRRANRLARIIPPGGTRALQRLSWTKRIMSRRRAISASSWRSAHSMTTARSSSD